MLCTLVFGCGRMADSARPVPEGKSAGEFGESLSQLVTTEAMVGHLSELQTIADRHDGNRAVGPPGYDASVDYVAGVLRDSGFDVQLPEFQLRVFETEKPELMVAGAVVDARALSLWAASLQLVPRDAAMRRSWCSAAAWMGDASGVRGRRGRPGRSGPGRRR